MTAGVRGLSVTATARHEVTPMAVGAGASLLLGLAGSFLLTVLAGSAVAAIRPGARVNQFDVGDPGANLLQTVNVLADQESVVDGFSGALGAGLIAGVGLGVDGGAVFANSLASAGGTVTSNTDITVRARSHRDARLARRRGLVRLRRRDPDVDRRLAGRATTRAFVEEGGHLTAFGNVLVSARDDSHVDLAAGVGGASPVLTIGAALTGVRFQKTTEAFVARDAVVGALGVRGPPLAVYTGDRLSGLRTKLALTGVVVEAISFDHADSLALGTGLAGLIGIAASATAHNAENTTRAYIDTGASVTPPDGRQR